MNYLVYNRMTVELSPFNLDETTSNGTVATPYRHLVCEKNFPCSELDGSKRLFVFIPLNEINDTLEQTIDGMDLRPVSSGEFIAISKNIVATKDDRFNGKVIIAANNHTDEQGQPRTLVFSNGSVSLYYTESPGGVQRTWSENFIVVGTPK